MTPIPGQPFPGDPGGDGRDARYRLMFDDSEVGFVKSSRDGTILECNAALASMLGLSSAAEALGQSLSILLDPSDEFRAWLAALGGERTPTLREWGIPRPGGGTCWGRICAWAEPAYLGQAKILMGAVIDLTDERIGNAHLQRRELYFRSLVENASDFITTVDLDGHFLYQSPSVSRVLGYGRDSLVGRSAFDIIHEEDHAGLSAALNRARSNPAGCMPVAFRVRHADGSWRELESVGQRLPAETGHSAVVVNSRDVSERNRMEATLRASDARYRAFFDEDLAGNFISTPDGRLIACNAAFATIFGFGSIEAALSTNAFALYVDGGERDQLLVRLRTEGKLRHLRPTLRRIDGTPVNVVENVVGEFDATGELTHIRGHVVDETAQVQLESQLRQSRRMEAIGSLAGGVAHDFNNILTTIIGYSQMALAKQPPNEEPTPEILEILQAGHRAAALTRQLLAFSRKQALQPRVLDLDAVLANLENMLRRVIGEDVELVTVPGLASHRVKADPGQIEQVIMNLVVNARDAMPRGGRIVVRTGIVEPAQGPVGEHDGSPGGAHAVLSVSDSGEGMDAATQARAFEPYFTTKAPGKGTGLGLSTVHGIVQQSGGRVTVSSELGRGTTFEIHLPLSHEPLETHPAREDGTAMPRGSETILVIEDEPAVRRLTVHILRGQGYTVLPASDGHEALQVATASGTARPDLLLADVVMPRLGGREVAEELTRTLGPVPVLFTSGYTDHAVLQHGALGVHAAFLQKPFSPGALARKVREVLDGFGAARE